MSGLRPSPRIRAERLEREIRRRELETLQRMRELRERIMYRSAPTLAAIYRAQRCLLLWALEALEKGEIERDQVTSSRRPPGSAEAETVDADTEDSWELRRRRDNGLGTARINRMHAVNRGAEPITDADEALRLLDEVLEAVDAGDTDRVLRLVGRI